MKYICKTTLWIIALISISGVAFGQSNEIKIRFIANAGLSLTDGNSTIYVDFPYRSGFWMYSKYDKSEITNIKDNSIFIFTHKHPDHYSIKRVSKIVRKHKGKVYSPRHVKKLEQLNGSLQDFSIQAFKTKHRFSLKHCSYLITWHGKKIYINGDTGDTGPVSKITGMDWAFMPAWTFMNAQEEKIKIDAKMVGLYHVGPGDKVTSNNPKVHVLDKQGEVIYIPY